jgi:hypothetical protein
MEPDSGALTLEAQVLGFDVSLGLGAKIRAEHNNDIPRSRQDKDSERQEDRTKLSFSRSVDILRCRRQSTEGCGHNVERHGSVGVQSIMRWQSKICRRFLRKRRPG